MSPVSGENREMVRVWAFTFEVLALQDIEMGKTQQFAVVQQQNHSPLRQGNKRSG
jgi:hypothetical protein